MSRFGVLRDLVKTTKKIGYPTESLRAIAHGELFSDSENLFFQRLGDSLENPLNREKILGIFGAHDADPSPLVEVLKTSIRFSKIKDTVKTPLAQKEIDFINLSISFLEQWFFNGVWVTAPERHPESRSTYAYFSTPAGILNALAKFKEMPRHSTEILSVDKKRLLQLCDRALKHALGEYTGVVSELSLRELERSYASVVKELGSSGNLASDLYLLKTCMVAGHISALHKDENIPAWAQYREDAKHEYARYDFSRGKTTYDSIHFPPSRLRFCLALVDYLKERTKK